MINRPKLSVHFLLSVLLLLSLPMIVFLVAIIIDSFYGDQHLVKLYDELSRRRLVILLLDDAVHVYGVIVLLTVIQAIIYQISKPFHKLIKLSIFWLPLMLSLLLWILQFPLILVLCCLTVQVAVVLQKSMLGSK